jgi:DNA invertase Pin-like site-specific DNA recombinase
MTVTHTGKFVAYYRVSTQRQGRSGLGVKAQQTAVRNYLNGGDWGLVAELTEVESGKRSDRPKLAEAMKLCRLHSATLIIAKLDRLARNVAFISNLMESGVEFHAVDFPQANRLTVHILAAVAEHEAKMISERTKAALARSKKKLGGYRGTTMTKAMRKAAAEAVAKRANARADPRPSQGYRRPAQRRCGPSQPALTSAAFRLPAVVNGPPFKSAAFWPDINDFEALDSGQATTPPPCMLTKTNSGIR